MAVIYTQQTRNTLQAILAYKQKNDGVAPSLIELGTQLNLVKSGVSRQITRLINYGFLYRTPGRSRNLAITGGKWRWAKPRPFPTGRAGDVLQMILDYKRTYDGNAPSLREISAALGLAYTGGIKAYLETLEEAGYLTTAFATDRHICIVGGIWRCDIDVLAQANPNIYSQRPLLPLD
jgi:SOS-response transcriptional repressor LexA